MSECFYFLKIHGSEFQTVLLQFLFKDENSIGLVADRHVVSKCGYCNGLFIVCHSQVLFVTADHVVFTKCDAHSLLGHTTIAVLSHSFLPLIKREGRFSITNAGELMHVIGIIRNSFSIRILVAMHESKCSSSNCWSRFTVHLYRIC